MTKEEIMVKRLDENYANVSEELRYKCIVRFPIGAVELMMQDYCDQECGGKDDRIKELETDLKLKNEWQKEATQTLIDHMKRIEELEAALTAII